MRPFDSLRSLRAGNGEPPPITGAEVKRLRLAAGLTQPALAARLGVRTESVWRWEQAGKAVVLEGLRAAGFRFLLSGRSDGSDMSDRSALVRFRRRLKLSQESFARQIGATVSAVSRWERGTRPLMPLAAAGIMAILGQSPPPSARKRRARKG